MASPNTSSGGYAPFPSFSFTALLNEDDENRQSPLHSGPGGVGISEQEQAFLDDTIAQMIEGPNMQQSLLDQNRATVPEHLVGQLWTPRVGIRLQQEISHDEEDFETPGTPVKDESDVGLSTTEEWLIPEDMAEQISQLQLRDDQEERKIEVPKEEGLKPVALPADNSNKTLLLLSPLSHMHVFSRKWVPKRYLTSIVERPQRLNSSAIGLAAAITVAGDESYVLESSVATVNLEECPHVMKVHGKRWPSRLKSLCESATDRLNENTLEVPDSWNPGDIYLSEGTLSALEGSVAAIETAVDRVFDNAHGSVRRCFVSIRPPGHHSHPCAPSGFCLINNIHVGIQYAAIKYGLTHAVIFDFDLHHGDGSQDICWKLSGLEEHADEFYTDKENSQAGSEEPKSMPGPKIGYFSLHDINSFPTEVGYATAEQIKNASTCVMAHNLCIWNVHMEPYSTPEEFDELYRTRYSVLFERAKQFLHAAQMSAPVLDGKKEYKAGVFLSAGFDGSEFEDKGMQRHGVHVPTSFYARFTRDAVDVANTLCDGRVISLLEGGYSDAAIASGVMSHLLGLQGHKWTDEYATSAVVRQLEKGCKPRWAAPKQVPANENWIIEAVRLGRSFRPAGSSVSSSPPSSASSTPKNQQISSIVGGTPVGRMVLRDRKSTPVYNHTQRVSGNTFKTSSPLVGRKPQKAADQNATTDQNEQTPAIPKHRMAQREDGTWTIVQQMENLNI
ncbi:histone deacetylase domain-containing protein [Lipomyces kononenkoae]|uniref:Histone deacetylase domain-containing protein n=1 Tax=Lipomyces kononenkoae TaxID=34357 RepID=A0ACC3SZ71_LIPKO